VTESSGEPTVPEDVTWQDLDRETRAALRSLPKEMAERVGAHLAMAGTLIEEDPQPARTHADVARRLAGRVAVVREASALTAYACGDFEARIEWVGSHQRPMSVVNASNARAGVAETRTLRMTGST